MKNTKIKELEEIKEFVKNNFKKEKYNVYIAVDDLDVSAYDFRICLDKYEENLELFATNISINIEINDVTEINGSTNNGTIKTKSGKILSYALLYRPWEKDIDKIFTFAEASEKWGLDSSTLRKLVLTDKVEIGEDVKKSGKTWLITGECMNRLYGEPK